MKEEFEKALKEAENLAKNGTKEEKERFVEWACDMIRWFSSQGDSESVSVVSAQYNAYLNSLNQNPLEELSKKTGKSRTVIYRLAKKLGRTPTEEEVMQRKNGRPSKYN